MKNFGDTFENLGFLEKNSWNILNKSSKIKNSENFLSRFVSHETIKNLTWFSTIPDRMVKIFFPSTHLSRSTASTYTQIHYLKDFLLRKCISDETIKNLAWFSTMPDRMVKIFFPLTHPSRSTVSIYTQNHDLEDFHPSKCVSNETIKNMTWFSTMPDRMVKIFFSSHPPLSLYHLHIHTKSRFGGFSPQQIRFKRNYKKSYMASDYDGSNGENSFSSRPHLSPYRLYIHTKWFFGGLPPQQMCFWRNCKTADMVFDCAGWHGENIFCLLPTPLYHLHIHTKWCFGGLFPQQMSFKRNCKNLTMSWCSTMSDRMVKIFFLSPTTLALPPLHTHIFY